MKKIDKKEKKGKINKILSMLGPGFITGASDDDPSGIATYSQTGALFGYTQLWTALYTIPFMIIVQETCGRIGMMSGIGLAGNVRKHYHRPLLIVVVFILLIANMINIGANLGAMANCVQLLIDIPFFVSLIAIAILSLLLQIFLSYKTYAKYLKYLTLSLIAYIVTAFSVNQKWDQVVYASFVPTLVFTKEFIMNIVAILGTTISPYLFFWQAGQEVEEQVKNNKIQEMGKGRPKVNQKEIREMRWDTVIGMIFSALIMWFIFVTCAATLHDHNITEIQTADQAAIALKPVAGQYAFLLFALGIIGTGLLSLPVLAGSAAYAVCETFDWKEGLNKKPRHAKGFYTIIALSILIGLLTNYLSIKPFQMLYYTAILNGACAPVLLAIIFHMGNNKKIMKTHTNSLYINIMGWVITAIMAMAVILLLFFMIKK